jgi:hypothetical protein
MGRTPWTESQPDVKPIATQDNTSTEKSHISVPCWGFKHAILEFELSKTFPFGHCGRLHLILINRIELGFASSFKLDIISDRSLTHGAEPFLRSCQLYSYSRTSQHFMELESSLPCSQEPCIGPYPESDQSNPYRPLLSL